MEPMGTESITDPQYHPKPETSTLSPKPNRAQGSGTSLFIWEVLSLSCGKEVGLLEASGISRFWQCGHF